MSLDNETMNRLTNKTELASLIRNGYEGKYSVNIGDLIHSEIASVLDRISMKSGISYKSKIKIPMLKRSANFVIENEMNPNIILDFSYSVTTSSGQDKKKEAAISTRKIIDEYNKKNKNKILFINFLDGAGWIGRQAAMREIHRVSDHVVNLNTLDMLESIIEEHMNSTTTNNIGGRV